MRNIKMELKTKTLEKVYKEYLKKPTLENKNNWFETIKRDENDF